MGDCDMRPAGRAWWVWSLANLPDVYTGEAADEGGDEDADGAHEPLAVSAAFTAGVDRAVPSTRTAGSSTAATRSTTLATWSPVSYTSRWVAW
jgi:hypothetical protein